MNKTKTIIILSVIIFIILVSVLLLIKLRTPLSSVEIEQKELFSLEDYLEPISLTPEEIKTLQQEGLSFPYDIDSNTVNLQNVRISDDIRAVEADINETDLSGLDQELNSIESDLSY